MGQSHVISPFHLLDNFKLPHRKTNIRTVSNPIFLEKALENMLNIYQENIWDIS